MGQKNLITRRWARRGTRPRAPHDQRTKWAYIFGAICPKLGKGAALVMPFADTEANAGAPRRNQCRGRSKRPRRPRPRPGRLARLHPSRRPREHHAPATAAALALNPVETLWQFMRQNWLSNRVFNSYDDIVAHCCEAWNKLTDQPWRIMSLGIRDWANGF